MCRSLTVLCVATSQDDALEQLERDRPHVLIVFGAFGPLIAAARERVPALRVVSDRDLPGADVVASSLEEVRGVVLGRPRPGGPVRS
jgi:hypothetical protein